MIDYSRRQKQKQREATERLCILLAEVAGGVLIGACFGVFVALFVI